jgi:hypothetical protein
VSDVAARAGLPDTYTERISDAEILAIADDVIGGPIADAILAAQSDFWVHTQADATISSGTAAYRLPARCLKPRDVILTDATRSYNATQLPTEERWRYDGALEGVLGGAPYAFVLEGNQIVFVPTPTVSSYSYRLRFWRRPSRLVPTSEAAQVASIAGNVVTCSTMPSTWDDSDRVLDQLEGTPQFASLADDVTGEAISAAKTFEATSNASELAVGDWLALPYETPVPQVPATLRPYLLQATVAGVLEALSDDGAGRSHQLAIMKLAQAQSRLRDRVPGERKKIINRHGPWHGPRWRWGGTG